MSLSSFTFDPSSYSFADKPSLDPTAPALPLTFLPSPPPSDDECYLSSPSFDLDLELDLDVPHLSSSTTTSPESTTTLSTTAAQVFSPPASSASFAASAPPLDAEALSNHHLQRYLHYKGLAAQAEAEARIQREQFEALLAAVSMPSAEDNSTSKDDSLYKASPINSQSRLQAQTSLPGSDNMLAYSAAPNQYYGVQQPAPAMYPAPRQSLPAQYQYQPHQLAAGFNAQAEAHAAMMRQTQQAQQTRSLSMSSYYMPTHAPLPPRSSFDASAAHQQALWTRQSVSSATTTANPSPPFPSTPVNTYPLAPLMTKTISTSSNASLPSIRQTSLHHEGETEVEIDEVTDEDDSAHGDEDESFDDVKPRLSGMAIPNLHGGGRGYVPGKTPDDPKKRHKCDVCGRGFARAFNLKSHVQTHNPLRAKPHQCPHPQCKRGFSRLHDLERHRQGIHSDGPLVEAKRQGVLPSVARAKTRLNETSDDSPN